MAHPYCTVPSSLSRGGQILAAAPRRPLIQRLAPPRTAPAERGSRCAFCASSCRLPLPCVSSRDVQLAEALRRLELHDAVVTVEGLDGTAQPVLAGALGWRLSAPHTRLADQQRLTEWLDEAAAEEAKQEVALMEACGASTKQAIYTWHNHSEASVAAAMADAVALDRVLYERARQLERHDAAFYLLANETAELSAPPCVGGGGCGHVCPGADDYAWDVERAVRLLCADHSVPRCGDGTDVLGAMQEASRATTWLPLCSNLEVPSCADGGGLLVSQQRLDQAAVDPPCSDGSHPHCTNILKETNASALFDDLGLQKLAGFGMRDAQYETEGERSRTDRSTVNQTGRSGSG